MLENCVYHIDLVTKIKFNPTYLESTKRRIRKLIVDPDARELFLNCLEVNESNRIEIYCESESSKIIPDEDLVEILESLESLLGGFIDGSRIETRVEIPLSEKVWVKDKYEWLLTHQETDIYLDGSYNDWRDPDWEE